MNRVDTLLILILGLFINCNNSIGLDFWLINQINHCFELNYKKYYDGSFHSQYKSINLDKSIEIIADDETNYLQKNNIFCMYTNSNKINSLQNEIFAKIDLEDDKKEIPVKPLNLTLDFKNTITKYNYKKMLIGKWRLDSSQLYPTGIFSICSPLDENANLQFDKKGNLKIYKRDSINPCGFFNYNINNEKMNIKRYDQVLNFKIIFISKINMILRSNYIPKPEYWTEKLTNARTNGYNLYLSKM